VVKAVSRSRRELGIHRTEAGKLVAKYALELFSLSNWRSDEIERLTLGEMRGLNKE